MSSLWEPEADPAREQMVNLDLHSWTRVLVRRICALDVEMITMREPLEPPSVLRITLGETEAWGKVVSPVA